MHICVCVCACECSTYRGQKGAPRSLELELQAPVSHLIKVLGAKLLFSARAEDVFLTKDPFFQPRSGVLFTVPAALTEIKDKSGVLSRELETTKEATGEFQTRGKKKWLQLRIQQMAEQQIRRI